MYTYIYIYVVFERCVDGGFSKTNLNLFKDKKDNICSILFPVCFNISSRAM